MDTILYTTLVSGHAHDNGLNLVGVRVFGQLLLLPQHLAVVERGLVEHTWAVSGGGRSVAASTPNSGRGYWATLGAAKPSSRGGGGASSLGTVEPPRAAQRAARKAQAPGPGPA